MAAINRLSKIMGQLAPATGSSSLQIADTAGAGGPLKVVVTGAAGNIAYAILFMIGNGSMLGKQKIDLVLLDIPPMAGALEGVEMEIRDCAFAVFSSITCTTDYKVAFTGCDVALLIGAKPRGKGMVRADLLKANASIFAGQGKALDQYASRDCKILVVGNPANTNALICKANAPSLPARNFTAMTRLDQNRADSQVASKLGCDISDISKIGIWGNHSKTMYPDINCANVEGHNLAQAVSDDAWVKGDFIKVVQNRGAAIIKARSKSSAASAAKAAVDHMRDWVLGTPEGKYSNMGVITEGNSYGIPDGLVFSFPCVCKNGDWKIVEGLPLDDFAKSKIKITADELIGEREAAM